MSVPLLKTIVMLVSMLCDRLLNVTTPPTAVRLLVPCNVPEPALRAAVTTVLLSPERRFPNWSSIRTTGCGTNATPAIAADGGWVPMVNCAAAAGLILKLLLTAELAPAAEAVNALLPLTVRLKSLNAANPFVSVVRLVVPLSVPLPLLKLKLTDTPDTLFPNPSVARTVTAGLMVVPATVSVGCCTNASVLAAAALMLNVLLTALVKPELEAVSVLLPLRLMLRLLKVAKPLASLVRAVVPLKLPLPLLSVIATDTPLLATLFPNASSNCTLTAGLIATPAVAPLGPCAKTNWLAEAALMVKALLATEAEPLVAVSTLDPTRLMLKFVKVAMPLPSAV